ncbi:hypothetical protein NO273_08960, partial [Campylobacter jejuni]|nr:hypothetical protein [Campylobacter jejuni]
VFRADTAVIPSAEAEVLETIERLWPTEAERPWDTARLFSAGETQDVLKAEHNVGIRDGKVVELDEEIVLASAEGISPPGPAGLADAA